MTLFSSHLILLLCLLSGFTKLLSSAAFFHYNEPNTTQHQQYSPPDYQQNSKSRQSMLSLSLSSSSSSSSSSPSSSSSSTSSSLLPSTLSSSSFLLLSSKIHQRNSRNSGNSNDEVLNRNLKEENFNFIGSSDHSIVGVAVQNDNADVDADADANAADTSETFYANYAFEDSQQMDDDSQSNEHINKKNLLSNDQPYPYKKRLPTTTYKLLYTNEVQLKQGRIKGIIRNFHLQSGLRDVHQFLGIPYAEAPVGSRRFMPAGAPLPWTSLKMATHLPPVCPQNLPDLNVPNRKFSKGRYDQIKRLLPYLKNENEDCLYLNIYVPRKERQDQPKKYPIIVYIHGESYEWNSGNPYDGSVLASYGQVIVVTLNYRLGILGFMKPGISEHTVSNFGLLDQIAALQWIKENIDSFDGDSSRVTLMGHGTGGSFVNFLMVSPVAVGLFHRAILMSGSAMSDWATSNQSLTLTMQIAHGLNCPLIDDNEELLNCLRRKRYQEFFKIPTSFPPFTTSLGPIVDGHVIPNQPYKVMSQYTDLFSRYDLLFGVTEIESYHIIDAIALQDGLRENERDQLLRLYMKSRYEIRPDLALAATLKKYTDVYNNPVKASSHEHRDVVLDILSDARIVGPLMQTGLFHADVNPRSYMYVFGHNSEAGPYANFERSIIGEELAFVFGAPLAPSGPFPQQYSPQEKLLSEAIMLYWTNFAKTGNPKAPWRDHFINLHPLEWDNYDIDWPEFNKRNQCYVNIGMPPSIEYKYRQIYMNYWNKELPDELNQIGTLKPKPSSQFHYFPSNHQQQNVPSQSIFDHNDIVTGQLRKYASAPNNNHDDDDGNNDNLNNNKFRLTYSKENPFHELRLLINKEEQNMEKVQHNGQKIHDSSESNNAFADNMLNAQPTFGIAHNEIQQSTNTNNNPTEQQDDNKILKSESTLHILIGLIVIFLILNIIIYSTFLFRQKKKSSSTNLMGRKLGGGAGGGILSYDGTTDDDLKRTKNLHDCDDSFIMNTIKKSNSYDFIGHHSTVQNKRKTLLLNDFQINRQISSSTLDTHAKVSDWMSQDIERSLNKELKNNKFPGITATTATSTSTISPIATNPNDCTKNKQNSCSSTSSFSNGIFKSFLKHSERDKVSIGIDATPQARSNSVLRQEPIEVTKLKSIDNNNPIKNIIICQEIDLPCNEIDEQFMNPTTEIIASSTMSGQNETNDNLKINHIHSRSDPVDMMYYTVHKQNDDDEQITSFINNDDDDDDNDDINVTSYDENFNEKIPLSAEQQLQNIQRRNFPKVLPNLYNDSDSYKRQSLPPNSFNCNGNGNSSKYSLYGRIPPIPPPRTISTLGRCGSGRRLSNTITTSPLMLANECPEEIEPQITENTLIVGPLVPKSQENIYSTLKRTKNPIEVQTKSNESDELKNCIKKNRPSGIKPPSSSFFSTNKSIEIIGPTTNCCHLNEQKLSPTGIIDFSSTKPKTIQQSTSNSRIPQLRPDLKLHISQPVSNNDDNDDVDDDNDNDDDDDDIKNGQDKSSQDSSSTDTSSSSTGTVVKNRDESINK